MNDKEFEATVVVICLVIVAFILGLGLIISENKYERIKMEIKVNEYVRTRDGKIDKTVEQPEDMEFKNIAVQCEKGSYWKEDIINYSIDIINLLEVGDYVNGNHVVQISKELNCVFIETTYYDELREEEKHNFIKVENIKSIVTHEQFSSVEYKVEEK